MAAMSEGKDEREWRGFAPTQDRTQVVKMVCYVCGSEDLSAEKCKVWCRSCHALIENCSGD
jgi:hypothetical protein